MKEQEEWIGSLEQDIYQELVSATQRFPVKEQREIQRGIAEMIGKAQDIAFMRGYE